MQVIENWGWVRPGFGALAHDADEDGESSITKAQAILERLRKRDLYKLVDEFIVPCEDLERDT